MKKFVLGIACAGLFISPALALEQKDREAELAASFKQADVIPDEKIDVGEFDIYNLKTFDAMDENADDSLVQAECFTGCFPAFSDELSSPSMVNHYRFEAIDGNSNGLITEAEFVSYGRLQFKEYDTDEDKYLNREEFYAFYEAAHERTLMVEGNPRD